MSKDYRQEGKENRINMSNTHTHCNRYIKIIHNVRFLNGLYRQAR